MWVVPPQAPLGDPMLYDKGTYVSLTARHEAIFLRGFCSPVPASRFLLGVPALTSVLDAI